MQTIGDDELAEAEAGARAGNLRELYYFVHGLAERGRVEEAIAFAHERAAEEGRTEPLAYLAEAVYADHGSSPNQAEWKRLMMIDALSDNSLENAEARESWRATLRTLITMSGKHSDGSNGVRSWVAKSRRLPSATFTLMARQNCATL